MGGPGAGKGRSMEAKVFQEGDGKRDGFAAAVVCIKKSIFPLEVTCPSAFLKQ